MRVQLPSKAKGEGFLSMHVCRICDYIFVTQEGQKRLGKTPPLIAQTMLLRQKKMVKLSYFVKCIINV